jgi:T-complex protein 1 subunit beta
MTNGIVGSMEKLCVTVIKLLIQECYRSKEQALISASEAAELIMRVDDIITCAPRPRK